jgi:hypothetical protein
MDILDEATKIGSKLNLQRKLFDSNSTRIGIRNSRAYAWLAVIYGRLSVFVDPLDGCIDKDVLARHLGHAILMRFALREMYEKDNRNIQLSEVSDADFESYIHGYMLREQDILRVARKAWLDTLIEKGRS